MHTEPDHAGTLLALAIELRPEFSETYFHLGVLLNQQERYDEAVTYFSQALDLAPDYAEASN